MKIFLAGFSLLASAFLAQAQTAPVTCSAATLTGTRSLVLTGRAVSTAGAFLKSYYGVGTATFDGSSKVTFNLTTDTNASQNVSQTLSGTYTLPSSCAGTLNITGGDSASFTLIAYNSGDNFTLTGQDASYNFTGSGGTQPTSCINATLSGAYTFSGNGFALSTGAILGVYTISGLLQFDGKGGVAGSWSTAISGTQTPDSVNGTYAVSSNCLATATISDTAGNADTLAFTLTSTNAANFSAIGGSPTNMFSITAHSTFTNPGLAAANAAGIDGGTPAGSLFSIYGSGLSTGTSDPTTFPLPTNTGGATVTVNGVAVPLTYVSPTQINAQMPYNVQPGLATVAVQTGSSSTALSAISNTVAVTIPATPVPGVYVDGSNHAAAENYPSYAVNSSDNPALAGSVVIVYFNGGGAVNNESQLTTGKATPNAIFPVTSSYSATIDGTPATVEFVGLAPGFAGLYQANIVIPQIAAGSHPLILTVGGVASNSTTISTK